MVTEVVSPFPNSITGPPSDKLWRIEVWFVCLRREQVEVWCLKPGQVKVWCLRREQVVTVRVTLTQHIIF